MNITTIIPIHEFNENVGAYLIKALESIDNQEKLTNKPEKLIISAYDCVNNVNKFLEENYHSTFINVVNQDKTDYQSQVNLAVKSVTTDYFSVLEYDDEYSKTFFYNADRYIKSYPDVDIFLTMMIETNENYEGIKLTNETVWSQQFVGENGEIGFLNINSLKQYTDFKLSGAIIKKSEFINVGGYKSNIKLTFMYELLLRSLNNALKIFTIPKIGYKHLATRENSLFNIYSKTMSISERKFWFETATKEANIRNDRVIDTSQLNIK